MVGLFGQSGSKSSLGSGMSMGNAEDLEYILVSTQYDDLKKASDEIVSELQKRPDADKHSDIFPFRKHVTVPL